MPTSLNSLVLNLYSPNLTFIYDYWKNHALTRQTFVGKVMSLLFNMLFRFVIAFLSRSKHLLILCLQSPYSVILEPKKIKSVTAVLCLVTQLCQTLCNPMDCSLPGLSAPARTLLLAHLAPGLCAHYCSLNTARTNAPQGLCICCHCPQE